MEYNKDLFIGGELTERVVFRSPLCALSTEIQQPKRAYAHFMSAFIVRETTPKVGQYLKGYLLKEFP